MTAVLFSAIVAAAGDVTAGASFAPVTVMTISLLAFAPLLLKSIRWISFTVTPAANDCAAALLRV